MGTGKTMAGELISNELGLDFCDIDLMIEREQNLTVSDIFKNKGEVYFRELERQTVNNICNKSNLVIATGGGTLLDNENLRLLSKNGIIFCFKANIETIMRRLNDCTNRPLITNKNNIKELYENRKDLYDKLPNQIDTSRLSSEEIALQIIKLYNEQISNPETLK